MNEPSSESESHPNKYHLSIIDLFTWITFVAIVFSLKHWLYQYSRLPRQWNGDYTPWLFGYQAIFVGAQLAAILFCVKAIFSKRQFPIHPGHYLLVIGGLAFLATMAQGVYSCYSLAGDELGRAAFALCFNRTLLEVVITFLAASITMIAMRKQWHWLIFFSALAIYAADLAFLLNRNVLANASWISLETYGWVSRVSIRVFAYLGFAYIAILVVCIVIDLFKRQRRDLLHWAGIIATVALYLGGFAIAFLFD